MSVRLTTALLAGAIVFASPAHASTLYDQLGAKPGLEKLVDRAVEIFTTDPRIAALFEDSNLDRHKRMLVELFCQLRARQEIAESGGTSRHRGIPGHGAVL